MLLTYQIFPIYPLFPILKIFLLEHPIHPAGKTLIIYISKQDKDYSVWLVPYNSSQALTKLTDLLPVQPPCRGLPWTTASPEAAVGG